MINDEIQLRLDNGFQVTARIIEIGESSLSAEIIDKKQDISHVKINLCVSLLKGKKFEFVIQKSAEIGISRIIPVITERTIPEIKQKENRKIDRWKKIAFEASKQSMRSDIIRIDNTMHINDLISEIGSGIKILAHPGENSSNMKEFINNIEKQSEISLLIGPEGGFSEREIQSAKQNGWIDINFGLTHMRSETAAIILPAIIIYEWGNRDEDQGERQRYRIL